MAIVEFKDVTRVYTSGGHELKALDGANFTLDVGKFVVNATIMDSYKVTEICK